MGWFIAGGFYKLDTKGLGPIRDRIIQDPDDFQTVLDQLQTYGLTLSFEDQLASMPRGYGQHDGDWYAPYLRLKSFIVQQSLDASAWASDGIVARVTDFAKAAAPLLEFGGGAAG